VEGIDDVEAIAVLEAEINHGEGRRGGVDRAQTGRDTVGAPHIEAAFFHGALETGEESLVVIDKKQGAVARKEFVDCAHLLSI
jgi:hypothetical protein